METIQVNATRDEINKLKESVIWNDIVTELAAWKEGFNREMNGLVDDAAITNPSTASLLLHMGDLNGRQKAVDYFISLPDVLLSILEDQLKSKQSEPTGEENE